MSPFGHLRVEIVDAELVMQEDSPIQILKAVPLQGEGMSIRTTNDSSTGGPGKSRPCSSRQQRSQTDIIHYMIALAFEASILLTSHRPSAE